MSDDADVKVQLKRALKLKKKLEKIVRKKEIERNALLKQNEKLKKELEKKNWKR